MLSCGWFPPALVNTGAIDVGGTAYGFWPELVTACRGAVGVGRHSNCRVGVKWHFCLGKRVRRLAGRLALHVAVADVDRHASLIVGQLEGRSTVPAINSFPAAKIAPRSG